MWFHRGIFSSFLFQHPHASLLLQGTRWAVLSAGTNGWLFSIWQQPEKGDYSGGVFVCRGSEVRGGEEREVSWAKREFGKLHQHCSGNPTHVARTAVLKWENLHVPDINNIGLCNWKEGGLPPTAGPRRCPRSFHSQGVSKQRDSNSIKPEWLLLLWVNSFCQLQVYQQVFY